MKFYVIIGFNTIIPYTFIPDPGLFETADEAMQFCKEQSNETCIYGFQIVRVGKLIPEVTP